MTKVAVLALSLLLAAQPGRVSAQQAPAPPPAPPPIPTLDVVITVIGTTPLSDVGIALDKLPAPVQAVTAGDFLRSGALDVSALLNDRLTAVHLNNVQGNPYQADLNYRGYTASPLLGTPRDFRSSWMASA